ncbi:MAG: cadherin repeat domain-containing protein, partial [Bacteroidota bacterium]
NRTDSKTISIATPIIITGPNGATGSSVSISVPENSAAVSTFSATEIVTWTLTGVDAAKFFVGSSTGVLEFKSTYPDFENPTDVNRDNIYEVTLTATGSFPLLKTTTMAVSVTITDIDDVKPKVTATGSTSLTPPTSVPFQIGKGELNVYDFDASKSNVTFSLTGSNSSLFTISSTGVLSYITAPTSTTTRGVTVNVTDAVGTTTHWIDVKPFNLKISEALSWISPLDNCKARTAGFIEYTIDATTLASQNNVNSTADNLYLKLEINGATYFSSTNTGTLAINRKLKLELPSSLLQTFVTSGLTSIPLPLILVKAGSIASDQDNPTLTKFQGNALTISSTIKEDCSILPVQPYTHSFMSSAKSDYTLDNCDNLAAGVNLYLGVDIVGTSYIDATKLYLKLALPAPINATLISSSVVPNAGRMQFFIIPVSKEIIEFIYNSNETTYSFPSSFELKEGLPADDASNNTILGYAKMLDIPIRKNRDCEPPTIPAGQVFNYVEKQAENSIVGKVVATDNIGIVSFNESPSNDKFAINSTTGEILITGATTGDHYNFSSNRTNSFSYIITAKDADGNSTTSTVTLNVTQASVVDLVSPVITGPGPSTGLTSTKSVAENTTAVHTFTANETVTWSIPSGADKSKFAISSTGALSFVQAPDFESPTDNGTNTTYEVAVVATDAAGNASTQTVTITVTNIIEAGVIVTPVDGSLLEDPTGGPAFNGSFDIVLSHKPLANVELALSSSDLTEGTVQSSVTFT